MVTYPKDYDCKIADQLFGIFTDEDQKPAVEKVLNSIKDCTEQRNLTKEQLGAEVLDALMEAERFNRGDE